jgi:hypothetical protein
MKENCIICALDSFRIDPPICECLLGYFENSERICEKCDISC